MQQQQQQQQAWRSTVTCRQPLLARQCYLCGGLSALSNVAVSFPLNKIVFRQQLHNISFQVAAEQVLRSEIRTLYRGALPPLLQRTCNLSVMFGCYATLSNQLERHFPSANGQARKSASALLAGCCEALFMPFERVQTLLQDGRGSGQYRHTFHAFSVLRSCHGIAEWYRGLSAVLLRNSCGSALYFVLKERTDHCLPGTGLAKNFIHGAALGAALSSLVYPLNVAKVHMQAVTGGEFVSVRVALCRVYVQRGRSLRRLFRGGLANCSRAMLSWGVVTASYEFFSSRLFAAAQPRPVAV